MFRRMLHMGPYRFEGHFTKWQQVPVQVVIICVMLNKPAEIYFEEFWFSSEAEKFVIFYGWVKLCNI